MVLESIVADLVNRFLGDYIENLNKSQLSLSIWGGDIVLNNLFVKESLLDELELPVKVVHGNIGQLTLKIPWKNLYTEPTVALLDGLYIIAVPRTSVIYNEEKELRADWDAKKKQLDRIEEIKKKEADKDKIENASVDSFTEKLIANIIKNLEVTITNIHLRYEDCVTDPSNPFSVGVTLHKLSLQTADEDWNLKVIKEATSVIHKMMELESFSVYWNCASELFSTKEKDHVHTYLKETISTNFKYVDHMYLIKPMVSAAKLIINMRPEQAHYTLPKLFLDVVFKEISIALAKNQYQMLIEFVESLERLTIAGKYRKYKPPNTSKITTSNERWKFAYKCILEDTVKRRRRMWSWTNIQEHRKLCRRYGDLYKTKLKTSKPTADVLTDIEQCERKLDVFNITMMRKQAEIAAKREGGNKDGGDAGSGWFSWLSFGYRRPKLEPEIKSTADRLKEALSEEEKHKLYEAIGYQEVPDADFPKEYVAVKLHVRLSSLRFSLRGTPLQPSSDVVHLEFQGIDAVINQRPSANAFGLSASLEALSMLGIAALDTHVIPVLATSRVVTGGIPSTNRFVRMEFETNPLNGECDTAIDLAVQQFEVKFDARTIIALAEFFKPPKDVYVIQLQAAAMAKLQSVRSQTATGLLYAINQQKFTKLTITLKPTCIIIPENGVYRENCQMLVLDLGELNVQTEKPPTAFSAECKQELLSLDEVKKRAFNKFVVRIKSIQMLMANAGEKWEEVRTGGSSSLHFLRPMAFNVDFFQCVIPNADLPKMKIIGSLPTLSLSLSDKRLCDMIKLLTGIPLPEGAPAEEIEEVTGQAKASEPALVSIREEDELSLVMNAIEAKQHVIKDGSSFLNATFLELEFEINEISVTLSSHAKDSSEKPLLKVVIESVGVQLTSRDLDTLFSGHLGGIYVQYLLLKASDELIAWYADNCRARPALNNGPLINLINTPIMDGKAFKLLTVDVLMANKKHPEFSTTYQNTLQNITMELSVLEILLHQEAILSTLALLQGIQKSVEKPEVPPIEPAPLRRSRRSSIASSVSYAVKRIERRRKGRKKVVVEITDVALNAQLNSLSIAVCNQERILTDVKIRSLGVCIALQKSTTSVRASLKDIAVFDHVPDPIYPKILSVEGGDLFKMSVIVHNGATEGSKYLDMRLVDTEVMLETACIKVIFLNKFVQDLLIFVDHFERARESLSQAGLAMANQAAAAAQSLSSRSSRLSVDIKVKAPVIIIPQNTRSTNAVVLDLGQLTVSNSFQITGSGVKSHDGFPPVLDVMCIELSQMKVSRALLLGTEMKAECQIIEPVTISFKLIRNLAASWYHGHPDNELNGKLQRFSVLLSQGDLKTIISILNENIQEGASKSPAPSARHTASDIRDTRPAVDFQSTPSLLQRERTSGYSAPVDGVYTSLKLSVSVDNVNIELYNGDSDLSVGRSKHEAVRMLARLRLRSFALIANVLSDTSMKGSVTLYSCELEDARPGRETGITKMMAYKESPNAHEMINMIDVGFIQDANSNKDVDVKFNGLQIVVCIGYVMELKDFFLNGLPDATSSEASASAQSTSESATTTPCRPTPAVVGGETKLQLAIIQPEIILVENPMNIDSHAVILTMHVEVMVRSSVIHQIMNASVGALSICSGIYNPEKRETSKSQLLAPLTMELHSNAPSGKDHHIEVIFLQNIVLNVCAASIRAVTATLSSMSSGKVQGSEDELHNIPNDLWVVKKLKDLNFWFLDSGIEKTPKANSGPALLEKELRKSERITCRQEQLVLKKCRVIVKLLGGVGHKMVPFVITDVSLRSVDARNWSSHLEFFCELTLEMCYYNDQLAVWEPLIEPIETDMRHRPWELAIEMRQTDLLSKEESKCTAPPQVIINVASNDILQLNVTKTALKVYSNLAQSFGEAYNLKDQTTIREEVVAPYILKNETGMFISVKPGSSFQITEEAIDGQYGIDHGQSLHLNVSSSTKGSLVDTSVVEVVHDHPKTLSLIFEDLNNAKREITVKRAEKRAFCLEQRASSPREIWQIIAQTDMAYGCKIITLRSTVQVRNTLPYAIELYYKLSDDAMGRCGSVEAGKTTSILCEAVYTPPFEIYFKPSVGCFYESVASCTWKDGAIGSTELIECTASKADFKTVFFITRLTMEPVLFESTLEASAKSYLITLSPTVELRNCLPTSITCKLEDVDTVMSLEPGGKAPLLNAKPSHSVLHIFVPYQSREWTGRINLERDPANTTVMALEAFDGNRKLSMDLAMHCERHDSGLVLMTFYCPYWMINKTESELQYKSSDECVVRHPSNNNDVVLFLCKSSAPATKKKISLRIGDSEWSPNFSLDTVGSVGTVECKFNKQPAYDEIKSHKTATSYKSVVGVQIRLCSNSMTKIVTFSPFFMIMNQAQFAIECKELVPNASWFEVPSGDCIPFWPVNPETQKLMVARIKGTMLETLPFRMTESHTTFLQLYHDYGGINVECAPTEGSISIIFRHYCPGFATALLINQTSFAVIEYHQKDMRSRCLTLNPGEAAMYTWQNPTGKRELTWSYGRESYDNELDKDDFKHFGESESSELYWVSFLDGMQRVLLFTEDLATVIVAQQAGELERVEQEINLNLLGIGLSLVSDDPCKEIAYMAITSSGVIWEKQKKKNFKPIKMKHNLVIEYAYQNYLSELLSSDVKSEAVKAVKKKLEVNFETMEMIKPRRTRIRRSFYNGISLRYRVSPHQTQIHLKIHRLQIDNQGAGAVFPVVLAPLPLPKTVGLGSAPKPFAELSVLIRKSQFSNVMQVRYCKILLQEFAVKIDQGFLGGLLSMFALSKVDEDEQLIQFNKDCELSRNSLMTDVIETSASGVQHFFDELHCSPIKVHLSFSLYGAEKNGSGDAAPQIQWQFLNLFLQSVGIVLTDMQDVVFKLGYFERKHAFYNQSQLTSEVARHYAQQAIKQMYVLVLGLDVLGNPFGVIRGLADGIEDFFYEPYQGAIQGPEEFAEGLAIGVKSLLGHAVGGAAGAVSRITGALGKGIATLTMDENYQRSRREAINKRPADLKEGLARGGQGLVMGVVHGFTGIVTKPIEGAKQEGVKGFFKGAGKGLVGVIARPASGVVDFASSSFDGIRRFTELSDEVTRLRPPRFFQMDGILRAYCYREAEGNQILQDSEKKKFASELYIGHIVTSPDCRHILVVTEKRAIYIGKGDVFGQWNCVWDYTWAQLKEPPQLTPRGIQILLKERHKKLIGSSTIGKMVVVQEKDKKYAELLVGKMRIAMTTVTMSA